MLPVVRYGISIKLDLCVSLPSYFTGWKEWRTTGKTGTGLWPTLPRLPSPDKWYKKRIDSFLALRHLTSPTINCVRQSRVRPVYCGLSASHPDFPVIKHVIASRFRVVSFNRINSYNVYYIYYFLVLCNMIVKCWCCLLLLWRNYSFLFLFVATFQVFNWLCLFAKTWWSLIYSEALTLLQYNHSLHRSLLWSPIKQNLKTSLYLPEMCVQQFWDQRRFLKKGAQSSPSSHAAAGLHSHLCGEEDRRGGQTVSCDIQAQNVVGGLWKHLFISWYSLNRLMQDKTVF